MSDILYFSHRLALLLSILWEEEDEVNDAEAEEEEVKDTEEEVDEEKEKAGEAEVEEVIKEKEKMPW